jgi:hypothetical protein
MFATVSIDRFGYLVDAVGGHKGVEMEAGDFVGD